MAMKQKQCYYECHITIEAPLESRNNVRALIESLRWSYSEHDEDHEIGPGLRCYANKSFRASMPVDAVITHTKSMAVDGIGRRLVAEGWGAVVRYKVEFVLYDIVTEALTAKGPHLQSRRNARLGATP